MKITCLFVVVLLGIRPVMGQNAGNILMMFLQNKDSSKFYYLPMRHSCGCGVAQFTMSGEFVQYLYATKDYYKSNPEFRKYVDSGGINLPYFPVMNKRVKPNVKKKETLPAKQSDKPDGAAFLFVFVTLSFNYKPGYRYAVRQRGKSGQHRAMHRLSAGSAVSRSYGSCGTDSATENNCPAQVSCARSR